MHRRSGWLLVALLLSAGCQGEDATLPTPFAAGPSTVFDRMKTGAITGSVTWQGDIPQAPPLTVHAYLDNANGDRLRGEQPNPHAASIDPASRGIGGVVLMLREAPPSGLRPWPHSPVHIEFERQRLRVVQDKERRTIGFVQRGAEFECVNRDVSYHSLRARGAAFFTLPLVAAEQTMRRRLDQPGLVELGSGASCYWQRAYLFVLDHPYATLSDATGGFVLEQVPPGKYRLALWMPNWTIEKHERDPETAAIRRITFAPAVEEEHEATVVAGQVTSVPFVVGKRNFIAPATPE